MFGSLFKTNILKTLDIEPTKLKDDTIYICKIHNHKGKPIAEAEPIEITGKELKTLHKIHGMKKGMIVYSNELLYDVLKEKEIVDENN